MLLISPFVVDRFWLCQRDKADHVRRELLCRLRQNQWSSCFCVLSPLLTITVSVQFYFRRCYVWFSGTHQRASVFRCVLI